MTIRPISDGCVVGVAAAIGDGAKVPAFDPTGDVVMDEVGVPPAHAATKSVLKTSNAVPVMG